MLSLAWSVSEFEELPRKVEKLPLIGLNGGYAAAYRDKNRVFLCRDCLGRVPLYYSGVPDFKFSDKLRLGNELNPRKILVFNGKKFTKKGIPNPFLTKPRLNEDYAEIKRKLKELLTASVLERSTGNTGVFFSGGLDSTVIAAILKQLGKKVICYTAGVKMAGGELPDDVVFARRAAAKLKLKLKVIMVPQDEVEGLVRKIIPIIGDKTVVSVGVSLPIFVSAMAAKRDGISTVFSGLGSEECFAGYFRHRKAEHVNRECRIGLFGLYKRDTFRDYALTKHFSQRLMTPFLDMRVVNYSLRIPPQFKINNGVSKLVLRDIAREIGIPTWIADRPKKAAQYGSGFHKALGRIARAKGFQYKTDFLSGLMEQ